jgi:hypothetical protein
VHHLLTPYEVPLLEHPGNWPDSQVASKNYYQTHKLDFVFIAEPMISISQVPMWFWKNHNVTTFGVNDRGVKDPNLWALRSNKS